MDLPFEIYFANVFLSFSDGKWLNQCVTEFKPTVSRTYLADTFGQFESKRHAIKFHNAFTQTLNSVCHFCFEGEKTIRNFNYHY